MALGSPALDGMQHLFGQVLLTSGGVDIITVSTDGTARVWDMEIGDCVLLLAGHGGPLTDVAASADGALLLTGAADGAETFERVLGFDVKGPHWRLRAAAGRPRRPAHQRGRLCGRRPAAHRRRRRCGTPWKGF